MSDPTTDPASLPVVDDFDPANQALSDALQISFRILKWLMVLVVSLSCLSGLFRVRPGEVGYVLRMGRMVGRPLSEGWHLSWPFPIDDARTMSLAGERSVTAPFTLKLNEYQKAEGLQSGGSSALRPGRDNYLLTGDLNILHARLSAQYRISDAIDYLSYVKDEAGDSRELPEAKLMQMLLSAAAIEVAARSSVDQVYKDRSAYLEHVLNRVNERLAELEAAGAPTGLRVRRVIATSFEGFEAIMPPLAVMPEFAAVQSAEQKKGQWISQARGEATSELSKTAGPGYPELAAAIDAEFQAHREHSPDYARLRMVTEELLERAGGTVREIIKDAEARRDRIVNEAAGDASQVASLAGEYRADSELVLERLRLTRVEEILSLATVRKVFITRGLSFRYQIKRDPAAQERAAAQRARQQADRGMSLESGRTRTEAPKIDPNPRTGAEAAGGM
ncbi:MAG: SPFH domain-containing protein [Phycisphaerae bacterium]